MYIALENYISFITAVAKHCPDAVPFSGMRNMRDDARPRKAPSLAINFMGTTARTQ